MRSVGSFLRFIKTIPGTKEENYTQNDDMKPTIIIAIKAPKFDSVRSGKALSQELLKTFLFSLARLSTKF